MLLPLNIKDGELMSYIFPNTDIYILKNVPLDRTYTHTYFPWDATNNRAGTRNTQFSAFYAYKKPNTSYKNKTYNFHLTNYSYQRKNRNTINVKIPYDILFDCNYLIFKNTSYENKYFYAFIDTIDYVNDNTSKITYTIDVMQTWHFDYFLNHCFVEREHVASDNRGENVLAEPFDSSCIVSEYSVNLLDFLNESWYIVFVLSFDSATVLNTADGRFTSGAWNQAEYWIFKCYNPHNPTDSNVRTPDDINSAIKTSLNTVALFGRTNGIITMYMCPESMLPYLGNQGWESSKTGMIDSINDAHIGDLAITLRPEYPDWTPHNAKLFTYPYCFFTIDNNQGVIKDYRYEFFVDCRTGSIQSGDILFGEFKSNAIKPSVSLIPYGYMQSDTTYNTLNYEESITIDDFAIGSWACNDLIAKVVQGGIGLAITAATLGASSVAPGVVGVAKTLFNNGVESAVNSNLKNIALGEYIKAKDDPDFDTDGTILNTIQNYDSKEKVPWGALGKDMVKTIGALSLLALRSRISSSQGNGNMNLASRGFDFVAKARHLDVRYAKKIDQFFDMYGYQTNEIKIPNRAVRPHWTYTKTTNCTIDGVNDGVSSYGLPHDDATLIQEIYNNGITFWKNLNEIGDYSLAPDNVAGQG